LLPKNIRSRIFNAMLLTAAMLALVMGGKRVISPQAWVQASGSNTAEASSSSGRVLKIDARTLRRLIQMDLNLYLVDVRETEELTGPLGHIKQAVHVSLGEVLKDPGQFPRNKTLVFICRIGNRSLVSAQAVAAKGRVAYSVKGGIRAWNKLLDQQQVTKPDATKSKGQKKKIPVKKDNGPDSNDEDMGC